MVHASSLAVTEVGKSSANCNDWRAIRKHPRAGSGLSATLGEPELAMQWLAGNTAEAVTLIDDVQGGRGDPAWPRTLFVEAEEEVARSRAGDTLHFLWAG